MASVDNKDTNIQQLIQALLSLTNLQRTNQMLSKLTPANIADQRQVINFNQTKQNLFHFLNPPLSNSLYLSQLMSQYKGLEAPMTPFNATMTPLNVQMLINSASSTGHNNLNLLNLHNYINILRSCNLNFHTAQNNLQNISSEKIETINLSSNNCKSTSGNNWSNLKREEKEENLSDGSLFSNLSELDNYEMYPKLETVNIEKTFSKKKRGRNNVTLGTQKRTNLNLIVEKAVINSYEDEDSSLSVTQQSLLSSLSKEKDNCNPITKQRRKKKSQLGKANELLEDTFLACLDRSKSTTNGETIAASAIEDPESFMKSHFPVVYSHARKGQVNRIDHMMTEKEFKTSSKSFWIYPNEIQMTEKNVCKKIWREVSNADYELTDFLFKVEQIWPANLVPFSIEFCLEYLMLNKYNYDKVTNLVKYRDSTLRNFIQGKKIEAAEIDILAAQNKKSYQLRKRDQS